MSSSSMLRSKMLGCVESEAESSFDGNALTLDCMSAYI